MLYETVSAWSYRLESILGKAIDRGLVQRHDVDGMLHSMLWTSLRTSLTDISGHKFDAIKDFDGLRVALRQIENDHIQRRSSTPQSKPQTNKVTAEVTTPNQTDMDELKGIAKQLVCRMNACGSKQTPPWNQRQQASRNQQQQAPWNQGQ